MAGMHPFSHFNEARWQRLCGVLGLPNLTPCFDEIAMRYAEPQRAYHTAQHIDECLALLDKVADQVHNAAEVELAIWAHDVIYDPQAHDNELRSAQLFDAWLAQAGEAGEAEDLRSRLRARVLATAGHARLQGDSDGQALLDMDLAILACSPDRFNQYESQIRFEYSFVPAEVYATKRREFLQSMASRGQLYHHPALAADLQDLAAANLRRVLGADARASVPHQI
jgi:predicted metal-dependent HD superfamily phosphohydrolase